MKMFNKDSNAVSPVIGVMLMLVVTVILAAAVSSTSTGLIKSSEAAPTAVFDVKIAKDVEAVGMDGTTTSYITIKEVTGDAIQTSNLKIVTTNSKAEGGNGTREILPGVSKLYGAYTVPGTVPYWNNVGMGYFGGYNSTTYAYDGNEAVNFGNYTLKPGVSMIAQDYVDSVHNTDDNVATWDSSAGDYTLGSGNTIGQMQDMFSDWDSVEKGDFVNVKIVDLKSGKVIFSSDVEVI
jgi:flagellin-like protein